MDDCLLSVVNVYRYQASACEHFLKPSRFVRKESFHPRQQEFSFCLITDHITQNQIENSKLLDFHIP